MMIEIRKCLPGCGGRKLTDKGEERMFWGDGNILIFTVQDRGHEPHEM